MKRSSVSKKSSIPKPRITNVTPSIKSNTAMSEVKNSKKRSSGIGRISLASVRGGMTPGQQHRTPLNIQNQFTPSVSRLSSTSGIRVGGHKKALVIDDSSFKPQLEAFLVENGYNGQLTRTTLKSPTAREFHGIFCFIYKFIDATKDVPFPFEEEIPKILKLLHYPLPIPKSAFKNVGSPHSWPSILTMLVWMTGLATTLSTPFSFAIDDEEANLVKLKFTTMCSMFHGEVERSAALEKYDELLLDLKGISKEKCDLAEAEVKDLKEAITSLDSSEQSAELINLEEYLQKLAEDKKKLEDFNHDVKQHISQKEISLNEASDKISKLKEELDMIEEEKVSLEYRKSHQTYTKSEVKQMKEYQMEYNQEEMEIQCEKKSMEDEVYDLERKICKNRAYIGKLRLKYKSTARQACLEQANLTTLPHGLGSASDVLKENLEKVQLSQKKLTESENQQKNMIALQQLENTRVTQDIGAIKNDLIKMKCKEKRLTEEIESIEQSILEEKNQNDALISRQREILREHQATLAEKTALTQHTEKIKSEKEDELRELEAGFSRLVEKTTKACKEKSDWVEKQLLDLVTLKAQFKEKEKRMIEEANDFGHRALQEISAGLD